MSNKIEAITLTSPTGVEDTCAKLTIDDTTQAYTLSGIATVGKEYTLSFWLKGEVEGLVGTTGGTFPSTAEWTWCVTTFTAEDVDVAIAFDTVGVYYLYHAQLEVGNKATDYTEAPEDVEGRISAAQSTADTAQSGMTDLTKRMIEAEASIKLNSDAISLKASKTETVTTVSAQYYQSSSETELVDGEWTSTPPAWVDGLYMWSRTVTTNAEGTITYSDPVCISGATGATGADGADGKDGQDGKDGVDAAQIVYEYALSDSSTVAPSDTAAEAAASSEDGTDTQLGTPAIYLVDSVWSTVMPERGEGQYVWQRIKQIYADGTVVTGDPVCLTGEKGDTGEKGADGAPGKDGADGVGVESVTNYYLATASASDVTTSTSGWTTDVQPISADKKYLWNYEVVAYTDGNTVSTTPCIIGAYGDTGAAGADGKDGEDGANGTDGKDGADGVGVEAITEHYAVSTSNSTAPTSWQSDVPTLTATDKYLWNYETISYTDGTSVDTAQRVIGVYGDTGADGAAGKDGQDGKDGVDGADAISYRIESTKGVMFLDGASEETTLTAHIYAGSSELDTAGAYGYTWYLVDASGNETVIGNGKSLTISTATLAGYGVYFIADDGGAVEEVTTLDKPSIYLEEVADDAV